MSSFLAIHYFIHLSDTQLKHVNLFLEKKIRTADICDHKEKETRAILQMLSVDFLRKNCYKRLLVKQWR